MINSRALDDLHPAVAERAMRMLAAIAADPWFQAAGAAVIVTSTWRDHEAQAAIYAQGRTKPGNVVTWAGPGDSFHNWRMAFDVVPTRHGKLVWGTSGSGMDDEADDDLTDDLELWQRVGAHGEAVGLEWAGRWPRPKREFPHFQLTGGLTLAQLKAGEALPELDTA